LRRRFQRFGMVLKAVFFDLDDTLVDTTAHDVHAYNVVRREIAQAHIRGIDPDRLVSDFKDALKKQPWDPGYPHSETVVVQGHRAALWVDAMRCQINAWETLHGAEPGRETLVADAKQRVVESSKDAADAKRQKTNVTDRSTAMDSLGAHLQHVFHVERLSVFKLVDGSQEVIQRLRDRSLSILIITNGHHAVQRPKLKACHAADVFGESHLIVSGEELLAGRVEKPEPEIFHRACSIAGCEPSEAVMVGDSLASDIQGATNAGLAASIWVNPKGTLAKVGSPEPSAEVKSVLEVEHVLERLGLI